MTLAVVALDEKLTIKLLYLRGVFNHTLVI